MMSWRDGIATLLAAAAVVVFGAYIGAWSMPLFTDARVAVLALGAVGIANCSVGSRGITSLKGGYTGFLSLLGVAAVVIFLAGVIAAWTLAPALLATDIALMWVLATARHALTAELPTVRT